MSRRKVRALTRTGRQVSEDPDIDNLLSNLSPEEMEELQKEVLTLPDPDPDPYVQSGIRKRTPLEKQPSVNNNVEHSGRETSKLNQRQLSIEVWKPPLLDLETVLVNYFNNSKIDTANFIPYMSHISGTQLIVLSGVEDIVFHFELLTS